VEEGYAREYLRINGSWQDHVLYGLLKPELRAAPQA
jgi:RimJ/RimL family protein N-acetyltransferase